MKRFIGEYILLVVFTIIISSCTSSDSKFENEEFINKIKPIPPGTAQICGTIQEVKDTSDLFHTLVRVDTIFNYGQSTPPLAVGNNLEISIPKNLILDSNDKSQMNEFLKLKRLVYLELKYQKNLSLKNKEQNKWLVSKIALKQIF